MQYFLIDDDPDDREIFEMALHEVDPTVQFNFAKDAYEALEKLDPARPGFYTPDCIFLDVNMHRMDGVQCLIRIRAMEHLQQCRVIMFSTSVDNKIMARCLELGANDFMAKPAGLGLLIDILKTILKK